MCLVKTANLMLPLSETGFKQVLAITCEESSITIAFTILNRTRKLKLYSKRGSRSKKQNYKKSNLYLGFTFIGGRITGRPGNIRQKGVDVLLAVEMLDHAFRKNMDEAWLLAGDADFVPLVEAVTRLGTWVNVIYDPRAAE